jgi:hypothetical protein
MNQPDMPTPNGADTEQESPRRSERDVLGEILDRLSYAVGLGSVMFIVIALPALFWPRDLGKFLNGYAYVCVLIIAYFCVPFARPYMPRIKPRP